MKKKGNSKFLPILDLCWMVKKPFITSLLCQGPKPFQIFQGKELVEVVQGCQLGEHHVWQEHSCCIFSLFQGFGVQAPDCHFHWVWHKNIFDKVSKNISVDVPFIVCKFLHVGSHLKLHILPATCKSQLIFCHGPTNSEGQWPACWCCWCSLFQGWAFFLCLLLFPIAIPSAFSSLFSKVRFSKGEGKNVPLFQRYLSLFQR